MVASGRLNVVISGGAEASMHPVAVAAFANLDGPLLQRDLPALRRPPRRLRHRRGAAALVARGLGPGPWPGGAHIYAEIVGAASTADAHHITAPAPDAHGAVSCMELALADAGLQPGDIAHINAHGTSTPLNDLSEPRAITKVFGDLRPPVTSTKGVTGHGLAAAGAIEAVASMLAIQHKTIPHTYGCEELDPEIPLNVVRSEPLAWEPGPILSNSFGFGGHNGCLIITPA